VSHRNEVTLGTAAVAISVAVNAVGGLLFWLVAARVATASVVGESQALYQGLTCVNYLANLGLPVALARYAGAGDGALATLMVLIRGAFAVLSAAVFVGAAASTDLLDPLWTLPATLSVPIMTLLSVGFALAVLSEVRMLTLHLWGWVAARAVLVALLRLPLVVPLLVADLGRRESLWLFLAAAGPVAVSGYASAVGLWRWHDRTTHNVLPTNLRPIVHFAGVNWLGLVATQGPIFVVPLIVAFSVDSASNAAFYVAWNFGAMAFLMPQMIGQLALSEASHHGDRARKLFHALKLALVLSCVGSVFAEFGAGTVAAVYGSEYDSVATHLPLLVAASIPWSYTSLGLTASRLRERHGEVLLISVVLLAATTLPPLVLTGRHGESVATWSWLLGNCAAAGVTGLLYLRWRLDPEQAFNADDASVAPVLAR
jgi:hypothetical protein